MSGERADAEKSLPKTNLVGTVWSSMMSRANEFETPVRAAMPAPPDVSSPLSVLVVDPEIDHLLGTVSLLSRAGFVVTSASTFSQARPLLSTQAPGVLLTASRLGMYNGLHLVVRGRALQPNLAAVVTSRLEDGVLQRETEGLGATFVLQPLADGDLIASILQTAYRRPGATEAIRQPFERRHKDRRVLQSVAPPAPDRRRTERRRVLPWLVSSPRRST